MSAEQRRENAVQREQKIDAAIEEYVQRLLAESAPLTEEKKRRLTRLLTSPRAESTAGGSA